MDLLLASGNRKKLAELSQLVADIGIRMLSPADVGPLPEVVEDGATFEENAAKKARGWAVAAGMPCLADDSGLEVDALGQAPGVRSARYAGTHGDDAANNRRLLTELAARPGADRTARFVCALAVAAPDGRLLATARGTVEGRIVDVERGVAGFGYDPLFECTDAGASKALIGRTFAELTHREKASVSHRSRALAQLREVLRGLASVAEASGAPSWATSSDVQAGAASDGTARDRTVGDETSGGR
jgi:XTP/dITP diphosphohydrolase